jgi:protein-S-isoprenylcysteine O-methyltransferase Ste14
METRPERKSLWMASFATHAARGLVRDQKTRRKLMMAAVIGALVLMVAGSTLLQGFLNPREHAVGFIVFWFACAWLAVLAVLLALFDLLIVRTQARAARKLLREQASGQAVRQADEGAANASKQVP